MGNSRSKKVQSDAYLPEWNPSCKTSTEAPPCENVCLFVSDSVCFNIMQFFYY